MELSHFTALTIFAFCVSIVFSLTTKESPRERLQYAATVFFTFLGVAFALGWVMFPFPP
jgi:hypothetical protein